MIKFAEEYSNMFLKLLLMWRWGVGCWC